MNGLVAVCAPGADNVKPRHGTTNTPHIRLHHSGTSPPEPTAALPIDPCPAENPTKIRNSLPLYNMVNTLPPTKPPRSNSPPTILNLSIIRCFDANPMEQGSPLILRHATIPIMQLLRLE